MEVDWLNHGATKKSDEKAGQRKSPASGALANENVSCQLAFEHKCSVDRRAQQKAQVAITLLAARNISFYAKTLSQLNFCTLLGGGMVDASCNDSMQELSAKKEKKDLIKDLKDLINGGIFSSFCIGDRFFCDWSANNIQQRSDDNNLPNHRVINITIINRCVITMFSRLCPADSADTGSFKNLAVFTC